MYRSNRDGAAQLFSINRDGSDVTQLTKHGPEFADLHPSWGPDESPTRRADVLVGTTRANVIHARGGADVVMGLAGNDRLYGGAGNDKIYGGAGNDTISGGRGDDKIFGGRGNDKILAHDDRRDMINCGPGHDTVVADPVDRTIGCERVLRR